MLSPLPRRGDFGRFRSSTNHSGSCGALRLVGATYLQDLSELPNTVSCPQYMAHRSGNSPKLTNKSKKSRPHYQYHNKSLGKSMTKLCSGCDKSGATSMIYSPPTSLSAATHLYTPLQLARSINKLIILPSFCQQLYYNPITFNQYAQKKEMAKCQITLPIILQSFDKHNEKR